MDNFFPSTLKVWDEWRPTTVPTERELPPMTNWTGPHYPAEFAHRLYAQEAFHSPTTVAEWSDVPFSFRSTSTSFLALSHAPPALAM